MYVSNSDSSLWRANNIPGQGNVSPAQGHELTWNLKHQGRQANLHHLTRRDQWKMSTFLWRLTTTVCWASSRIQSSGEQERRRSNGEEDDAAKVRDPLWVVLALEHLAVLA